MLYDADRDELVFAATETLRENAIVGPPASAVTEPGQLGGAQRRERGGQRRPRRPAVLPGDRPRHAASRPATCSRCRCSGTGRVVGVLEVANRTEAATSSDEDRVRLEGSRPGAAARTASPSTLCRDAEAMRALLARAVTTAPSEAAALLLARPRRPRARVPRLAHHPAGGDRRHAAARQPRHRRLGRAASARRYGSTTWPATRGTSPASAQQTGLAPRTMICVPMISKDTLRGRHPDHQQGRRLDVHRGGAVAWPRRSPTTPPSPSRTRRSTARPMSPRSPTT